MNYPLTLSSLLLAALSLFACHKKEKMQVSGTYFGLERHIQIDYYGDTITDSTSSCYLTLLFADNKTFKVLKPTYPHSCSISAKELVKNDSVSYHYYLPEELGTIRVKGDSLLAKFEENSIWDSYQDHYIFSGRK